MVLLPFSGKDKNGSSFIAWEVGSIQSTVGLR